MQRRKFNERCARDCSFEMNVIQLKRQSWNLAIILLALVLGLWRISQLPQFGAYEARTFVRNLTPNKSSSLFNIAIQAARLRNGLRCQLVYTLSFYYLDSLTNIVN